MKHGANIGCRGNFGIARSAHKNHIVKVVLLNMPHSRYAEAVCDRSEVELLRPLPHENRECSETRASGLGPNTKLSGM